MLDGLEEPGALGGIVPELVAQDAEGPRGVAEAAGDRVGRAALHKEAAQGLVLPVERGVRGEKEPRGGGR
jgi:hypothetical protein